MRLARDLLFAAVAAAAAAALALVIALSRFRRSCVECRRASVLLWTRLARIGPFRGGCAILPLGALAARRPLLSERVLRTRVTVLTVLTLRAFTAVIAAASLTRIRMLVAPAEAVAVATVAGLLPGRLLVAARCRRRLGVGRSRAVALEPTEDAIDDARMPFGARRLRSRLLRADRRRALGRHALHRGLLARRAHFLRRRLLCLFFDRCSDQVVACGQRVGLIQVVVTKAFDLVVGSLEIRVRDQHHVDLEPRFDRMDVGALFVEQERGDVYRHLGVHRGAVLLHRFFLDDAQDMKRSRFGAADVTGAVAARAGDVAALA